MKNRNHIIFTSVIFITIVILGYGIHDLFVSSSDGLKYVDKKNDTDSTGSYSIVVSFVPIGSPGYVAGLQAGDTIISINGRTFVSQAEMNGKLLHRLGNGKLAIYRIKRNSKFKIIPVILKPRRARNNTIIMTMFTMLGLLLIAVFYLSFPVRSRYPIIVLIFYILILISYVYSYVSFEVPYKYIFLILAAPHAPALTILLGLYLLSAKAPLKLRIIPFLYTDMILIIWLAFYIIWVRDFNPQHYDTLMNAVKLTQLMMATMGIASAILIVAGIKKHLQEGAEHYIAYVSLSLLAGFLPYIILFALPVALGKREVISIDLTLVFIFIPLLSVTIYNNFFLNNRGRQPFEE